MRLTHAILILGTVSLAHSRPQNNALAGGLAGLLAGAVGNQGFGGEGRPGNEGFEGSQGEGGRPGVIVIKLFTSAIYKCSQ
jgi:hypothetical protein